MQQDDRSLDQFPKQLMDIAKGSHLKLVSAEVYCAKLAGDAFIRGIRSNHIRQRILEGETFDL